MDTRRPPRTRFAHRGAARLAYDPGEPLFDQVHGQAVLLLHDLLADRSSLGVLQHALAAHYRVIAPDARGHGASASLANQWYTIGELATDALAILDAEQISTCHVIGYGLGGATAFELARRHPGRVRSLVLIEPALYAVLDTHSDPAVRAARQELRAQDRAAGELAYKGLMDKALDAYLAPRWGQEWRSRMTRPQLAALYRHAGALAALLPALDAYDPSPAAAAEVQVPTMVIAGEGEPLLSQAATRLAALLPNAVLLQLPEPVSLQPGSDTRPAPAADAIARFLAEAGGASLHS
jgi:3-oxoadipate enol-lactonase